MCRRTYSAGNVHDRGKMLYSFAYIFSIRLRFLARRSFLQISLMPGKWLIFYSCKNTRQSSSSINQGHTHTHRLTVILPGKPGLLGRSLAIRGFGEKKLYAPNAFLMSTSRNAQVTSQLIRYYFLCILSALFIFLPRSVSAGFKPFPEKKLLTYSNWNVFVPSLGFLVSLSSSIYLFCITNHHSLHKLPTIVTCAP